MISGVPTGSLSFNFIPPKGSFSVVVAVSFLSVRLELKKDCLLQLLNPYCKQMCKYFRYLKWSWFLTLVTVIMFQISSESFLATILPLEFNGTFLT